MVRSSSISRRSSRHRTSSSARRDSTPAFSWASSARRSRLSRPVIASRSRMPISVPIWAIRRWQSSTAGGVATWPRATRAQVVSRTLTALSGSCRPEMYRCESRTAASTASSRTRTLWCCSSVLTSPRIMAIACASPGSSTLTTWKRRESAGSFSKYFLYSDHVVAAMVRSSPRARAGLSRLAASP